MQWFLLPERCEFCGRFVSQDGPGVSWRQTWSYDMDGTPNLHDPRYRCSPCTDVHGIGATNCANPSRYSGRNPLNPAESSAGSPSEASAGNPAHDEPPHYQSEGGR